jgi:hypothetical protein
MSFDSGHFAAFALFWLLVCCIEIMFVRVVSVCRLYLSIMERSLQVESYMLKAVAATDVFSRLVI